MGVEVVRSRYSIAEAVVNVVASRVGGCHGCHGYASWMEINGINKRFFFGGGRPSCRTFENMGFN